MRRSMLCVFCLILAALPGCGKSKPTLTASVEAPPGKVLPQGLAPIQAPPNPAVPVAVPAVKNQPVNGKQTLIRVLTVAYSPDTDAYKVLPHVNISVKRGNSLLRKNQEQNSAWHTNEDGEVTIIVPYGEPVTLAFEKLREDFAPRVQQLATAGTTHDVTVALIRFGDLKEFEKDLPNAIKWANLEGPQLLHVFEKETEQHKKVAEKIREHRPHSSGHFQLRNPGKPRQLTPEEKTALDNCLTRIRNCQVKNGADKGALSMTGGPLPPRVQPYFANRAAIALLDADFHANNRDVVRDWLLWYADRLDDQTGVVSVHQDLGQGLKPMAEADGGMDTIDAWAAAYLLAVARYHRIPGIEQPDRKMMTAALRSLQAIEEMSKAGGGLTVAKPSYALRFLRSNLDVYAALVEAGALFERYDLADEAERAFRLADRIAEHLADHGKAGYYPVSESEERRDTTWQAEADLLGLAYLPGNRSLDNQKAIWQSIRQDFKPENGAAVPAPVERWLIAAQILEERGVATAAEVAQLRQQMVTTATAFDANMYIQRPADSILALVDGPARYCEVLPPRKP